MIGHVLFVRAIYRMGLALLRFLRGGAVPFNATTQLTQLTAGRVAAQPPLALTCERGWLLV